MSWYYGDSEEYLEHYGVLGMKWGQHKLNRMDKKSSSQLGLYMKENNKADLYTLAAMKKKKQNTTSGES